VSSPDDHGLERNAANHVPLSPLSFLARAAQVYPTQPSVLHGRRRFTWSETATRCRQLASALRRAGVGRGDTVAALLPNVPAMVEMHFGVPMAGAILNTLNTRLDAQALALLPGDKPLVIDVWDSESSFSRRIGSTEYELFLDQGDAAEAWEGPRDEWDAICLNYTSGTTGDPKGVVYHHRGAYLNACSNALGWPLPQHAVYLWTLPMFHCNGWCMPWTLALVAGVNVCLRKVEPERIAELVREHKVTHLAGAPIVYGTLVNAWSASGWKPQHGLHGMIAGAAPPAAVIAAAAEVGIALTHVYGLTEVYGPAAICAPQTSWAHLPIDERARLNGRQGVAYPLQEGVAVLDPETLAPVPRDGTTIGEIFFRGNLVMKGYLKNPAATARAFEGGWFHTGDLAVVHADGYIKIKDRSKDIIISGGENISSVEVEEVLYQHPAVLAAAVVAQPDTRWGETPCAFVELKAGLQVDPEELITWCRARMAHFKAPRAVVLGLLPKTSTGKIQKFVLREQARSVAAIE